MKKDTELFIRMNSQVKRKLRRLAKRADLTMSNWIERKIVETEVE